MQNNAAILPDFSNSDSFEPPVAAKTARFESLFPIENDNQSWEPLYDSVATEEISELTSAIADMQNPASLLAGFDDEFAAIDSMQAKSPLELDASPLLIEDEISEVAKIDLNEHESAITDLTKHHEDAIAELICAHDAKMEELSQSHRDDVISFLMTAEKRICDEVALMMEEKIAPVLSELATEQLTQVSIAELTKQVCDIVQTDGIARLRLMGPETLTQPIKDQLETIGTKVDLQTAEVVDVTVTTDDSVLMTKIGAWADRLRDTLRT